MDKRKKVGMVISVILGIGGLLYLGGILGQVLANYQAWLGGNGISGEEVMKPPDWNLLVCIRYAFTINGLKGMIAAILLVQLLSCILNSMISLTEMSMIREDLRKVRQEHTALPPG